MTKNRSKVPAKRRDVRPKIKRLDPILAEVLADHQLEQSVTNWFLLPWRDGWNAAWLGWACWYKIVGRINHADDLTPVSCVLIDWYNERCLRPGMHEEVDQMLVATSQQIVFKGRDAARFLHAGLRCVQLIIANSHGGGNVFNDVLRHAFDRVPMGWHAQVQAHVREARGCDALGLDHMGIDNTPVDRLREAFNLAWDQGLFHAAYALPHASFFQARNSK